MPLDLPGKRRSPPEPHAYDQLGVTGGVSLNGDLRLSLGYAPLPGTSFTLLDNGAADAIGGTFSKINGASFGAGNTFGLSFDSVSYDFQLSYGGGSGNDLVIQSVPKPSVSMLLASVGFVVLVRSRHRLD